MRRKQHPLHFRRGDAGGEHRVAFPALLHFFSSVTPGISPQRKHLRLSKGVLKKNASTNHLAVRPQGSKPP
jgi:hypothetical protein